MFLSAIAACAEMEWRTVYVRGIGGGDVTLSGEEYITVITPQIGATCCFCREVRDTPVLLPETGRSGYVCSTAGRDNRILPLSADLH